MSYVTGETLIYNAICGCTGFATNLVSQGNYGILNSGKGNHYAILHIAGNDEPIRWLAPTTYSARWRTAIELWQRYVDDYKTLTDSYTHLTNMISYLTLKKDLDDTANIVQDSRIVSIGEPEEMRNADGGISWLRIRVDLEWQETNTSVSFT